MANRLVFEQYETLTEFAKSLSREPNNVFRGRKLESEENGKDFTGTESWAEAMNLFNNGWTDKVEEIKKDMVQFEKAVERDVSYQKNRPQTSIVGFAPHVPNAILGLPNSMIHTERTQMKAKVVRLVYNMCVNCGWSEKDIMKAGLTVLKIAYSMELKGYRVRIDANPFLARSGKEETCALVCIKDWRQPIDIKKIAFPLAHPSMFRRLGFRWLETVPELTDRSYISGYGRSLESDGDELLRREGVLGDKDYFISVTKAKEAGYDPEKLAEAIGIKKI